MLRLFTALLLVIPFAQANDKIIYGEDNRHDVINYVSNASVINASTSTVALFKSSDVSWDGEYYRIATKTYSSTYQLCANERFGTQPTGAFCSGFLIAPNKIVTAGHCITSKSDCDNVRFVFDYRMADASKFYQGFKKVYSCKRVLGQNLDRSGVDFAVVELDQEVTDRMPLTLASEAELLAGDGILTIGHPNGLPTKITDKAKIRSVNSSRGTFVTNLDTFGGNSGSAVFNEKTMEVVGILVRGDTDHVVSNGCRRENRVGDNSGMGETVSMISKIHERGFFGNGTKLAEDSNYRYIWFSWFNTCNEFKGTKFIREVEDSYCPVNENLEHMF